MNEIFDADILPEKIDLGQGFEMRTHEAGGKNLYYISVKNPKGKLIAISHTGNRYVGPLTRDEAEGWAKGLMSMFQQ